MELTQTIIIALGIAAGIGGGLWIGFKQIAAVTKSTKDDEFIARVEEKVKNILAPLPDELEQKIKDAFKPTDSQ